MSDGGIDRDKIFDHEYDGIREYDNPMPRWWVLLFVLSIVFCFPYIVWYHFSPGNTIEDALDAEIAAFAQQLLATYGELQPDAETLLRFMDDDVAMTGIAGLYKGKCAQCHLADGSGNVGPNLTDPAWINVREITDIATILDEGVVKKGMPAWGDKLTTTQLVLLSSYVARLSRTPVAGKAAEGTTIPAWPAAGAAAPTGPEAGTGS